MKWESTRQAYRKAGEELGALPSRQQVEEAVKVLLRAVPKGLLTLGMCGAGAVEDIVREFRKAMREATERRQGKQ